MALRTADPDQAQDARYNPGEMHSAELFPEAYASSGADQAESFANDPKNASENGNNTLSKKEKKEAATADASVEEQEKSGGWKNSYSGGAAAGAAGAVGKLSGVKKKGPLGLVLLLLILGGTGFSFLSLTILPIQFKETLFGSLNDQLAAMDMRTDHLLRTKLKGLDGSVDCSSKVRCSRMSMSDKQVERFKKAGFSIEVDKTGGRNVVKSFKTPSGVEIKSSSQLIDLANKEPGLRSALRKAYNPKFAGYSDNVSKKVNGKYKVDKSSKVVGANDEERNKSMDNATKGDGAHSGLVDKAKTVQDDGDGKKYYMINGEKVYEGDPRFSAVSSSSVTDRINSAAKGVGRAVSSVGSSILKGVSLLGYADSACTVYNVGRAVGAAAKVTRAVQVVQFFYYFSNFADKIKAGDATEEESQYINNKLTAIDTNKTTVDESSITGVDGSAESNFTAKEVPNPDYGKSATDSDAYKAVAYNEAPTLSTRAQQFMIGGGLTGTLASVLDTIANILQLGTADSPKEARKAIRDKCGLIQSWWARGAGLIAGIVAGIGTFGASTVASVGASLAIGFATPFLEAALADIVAGKVVDSKTANVDIGSASVSGAGGYMGEMAKTRGMKPAKKSELKEYLAITNEVQYKDIAMETYEARDTPFDAYNQYSFLGSFMWKINPTVIQSSRNVASAITNIPVILGAAFSSIIPQAKADEVFNEDRFSKCTDAGYDELGIDADIMCNPRYVMDSTELNMDPVAAVDYMTQSGQINPETGAAMPGSDYEKWIKYCPDRTAGWGETDSDDAVSNDDLGLLCMENGPVATVSSQDYIAANNSTVRLASVQTVQSSTTTTTAGKYQFFRVYHMDGGVNSGMDGEETASTPTSSGSPTAQPSTEQPANTQKSNGGKGWDLIDGQDYSNTACAAGTEDAGVQKHPTKGFTIRLCKVNGATVASLISLNIKALFEAATAAGINLTANSSYRTYDEQIATRKANGCDSGCRVPTATPGTSQHERALAIDFGQDGSLLSSSKSGFSWLQQNASKYGLVNLPSEAWHWSSDGS